MLSLNHDLFVSGIDAMGFDAHAQSGRQSKLEKSYNAEVKKAKNIAFFAVALSPFFKKNFDLFFFLNDLKDSILPKKCLRF